MRQNIFHVLTALALFFFFGACSKGDDTRVYKGPGGTVEVSTREEGNLKEMRITSEESTTTFRVGESAVPDDLGIPVYPGARVDNAGSWTMSGDKPGALSTTVFTTNDSVDKVAAFYKKELAGKNPDIMDMGSAAGRMVMVAIEDGDASVNIMILNDPEGAGTRIQIQKAGRQE